MNPSILARIAGVLMIGVFIINVYIGLFDTNLRQFQPTHWYVNWVLAVLNLIAAGILLSKPRSVPAVGLAGVVWPILYVGNLALDVETRLCFGGNQANCFGTRHDAFNYLILNSPAAGWKLATGTIPLQIALLFVAWLLSLAALFVSRSMKRRQVPAVSGGTAPVTRLRRPA